MCGTSVQGFGALYAGVLPALISVAPSGAVFYGTYDLLKVPSGLYMQLLACRPMLRSAQCSQSKTFPHCGRRSPLWP